MDPKVNTFSIPSKPDSIGKVEAFIEELQEKYEIPDDVFGNILISITEAANNAIIHGNRCDESKEVTIDVSHNENSKVLTFKVQDEGEGFDFNNLPDPTSPENLEKITGRGVFLMKQLADWVIFADGGSQVELQFRL
jgi:serine/threonine-protein kinase RsbW